MTQCHHMHPKLMRATGQDLHLEQRRLAHRDAAVLEGRADEDHVGEDLVAEQPLGLARKPLELLDRGPDFALLLEAAEASDALHELVHVTLPAALNP